MQQQNSVSGRPVIDLSDDSMAVDDPFSNITTGSMNSGAVLNSGASTVNLQSEAGPSLLRNIVASIPPAVRLPPDWDRPLRNPIPQNITSAPFSLYKGKSCALPEINCTNCFKIQWPSVIIIESLIYF